MPRRQSTSPTTLPYFGSSRARGSCFALRLKIFSILLRVWNGTKKRSIRRETNKTTMPATTAMTKAFINYAQHLARPRRATLVGKAAGSSRRFGCHDSLVHLLRYGEDNILVLHLGTDHKGRSADRCINELHRAALSEITHLPGAGQAAQEPR